MCNTQVTHMGYESDRVLHYLPWASRFARICASKVPNHIDMDDLQSAGVLGYLRAASRFDEGRGASFRGYCALRIRGAVLDELRKWSWAPRSVYQVQKRISHVTVRLIERLDREPNQGEIATALGMREEDLVACQTQALPRQLVSFDEMSDNTDGEEGLPLRERLSDPTALTPDAILLSAEDRRRMLRCLATLPKTQLTVIVLHYLQSIPLCDVAQILSVTPSRVSQLHQQALRRLKQAWHRTHLVP
jgi:RNA polymerase sigma factor for flagellar operon FliA